MKLLRDTHTFLWFIDDSPLLSARGKALLEADNDLLLSIGSLWEIAIKLRLGKLTVAMPTEVLMTQQLRMLLPERHHEACKRGWPPERIDASTH